MAVAIGIGDSGIPMAIAIRIGGAGKLQETWLFVGIARHMAAMGLSRFGLHGFVEVSARGASRQFPLCLIDFALSPILSRWMNFLKLAQFSGQNTIPGPRVIDRKSKSQHDAAAVGNCFN
jgi:hypothetical protein